MYAAVASISGSPSSESVGSLGGNVTRIRSLNNLGQVLGTVDDRAFLYSDGDMIDLNTLVDPQADLLLTSAIEINNRSQILARSCDRTGVFCYGAVLLTPVPAIPEAATIAMLLTGLAVLRAHRVRLHTGQDFSVPTGRGADFVFGL